MQQAQRIHQLLHAAPITVAGQILQPVAQLDGWWGGDHTGEGAWVRLSPASLTVQDGERTYEVSLSDPTEPVIRTLLLVSGAVAIFALVVMLFTTAFTRRR